MDLLKSISHPDEVYALLKFKLGGCEVTVPKCDTSYMNQNAKKCYEYLNQTSRSFAAVIQALEGDLRHAVCIFYLVLRALDTVEDDTTIPSHIRIPMLKTFYKNLKDPKWRYTESKDKDRIVLEDFPAISAEFRSLAPVYQEVISDICKRMGEGMTVYLDKSPGSMEEWDEYCHYVAGLVGIGLSRLFSASELEDEIVGKDTALANSMGLFLQKTNIIRDYLEDILQGREFWPKGAWGKYCKELIVFSKPENIKDAVTCLNELITNAVAHIPDVIKYMGRITNQSVFNFCAIPQVMAIGTLERCYNNPDVFKGVVKIRKGEAVRMMMEATNMENIKAIMKHFTLKIEKRIPQNDRNTKWTRSIVEDGLACVQTDQKFISKSIYIPVYVSFAMIVSAVAWQYWNTLAYYADYYTE